MVFQLALTKNIHQFPEQVEMHLHSSWWSLSFGGAFKWLCAFNRFELLKFERTMFN